MLPENLYLYLKIYKENGTDGRNVTDGHTKCLVQIVL